MAMLLDVVGLRDRTTLSFQRALHRQATASGLNPNYLAAVMAIESGFRPEARNPNGKALGLIQFWEDYFPPIAARAGRPDFPWSKLATTSAEGQLPFVMAYYAPYRDKLKTAADYYLQTFFPAAVGKPADTVLGREGSDERIHGLSMGKVYDQNRGLDHNKDGEITVGDVTLKVREIVSAAAGRPPIDIGDVSSGGASAGGNAILSAGVIGIPLVFFSPSFGGARW